MPKILKYNRKKALKEFFFGCENQTFGCQKTFPFIYLLIYDELKLLRIKKNSKINKTKISVKNLFCK
ncbi:hypothetical protein BpHYR1_007759 [Brachionus plicatilis]|uniref:Uncharacterized protein n=1 Tax=Brachionus plicatilis TaxID=10195 RepID=A0A3M7RNX1_BRAPC|nr:hypothetical protein BpHYR1_007759 [Brachionus plicatilis]